MNVSLKTPFVILFLLIIQGALLLYLSWGASHNRTERGHIGAAVYFWKTGRFDLFCVNPPLTRVLCGIPVALTQPKYDWKSYSPRPQDRSEWAIGKDFMNGNDEKQVRWCFFLARAILIPFILFGGWFGYRFASELYGKESGIVFLVLWTFSPLFLGWGATICPDMTGAALGVIGFYTFWKWLQKPTWKKMSIAGICLGLMPLTKMTWITAFALYPVLWGIWRLSLRKKTTIECPPIKQLALLLFIGLYVINMGYVFDGSFRPLGKYAFFSSTLSGKESANKVNTASGNRFEHSWLGKIPVPLPADFVQGIDLQKRDFECGFESYLNGVTSQRGWKSYYLYVLLYKEPVGTLSLAFLAVLLTVWGGSRHRSNGWNVAFRDEIIPLFPAIALFLFISWQDGISIHPRYILPVLPLAYIFISKTGRVFQERKKVGILVVTGLLLATVVGSLSQYPHSISYFNEFAGGIKNGPAHLLGSNADWGQSLYFLQRWCLENSDKQILTTEFYEEDKKRYELDHIEIINQTDLITNRSTVFEPGYYALSVGEIFEKESLFSPFLSLTPIQRIGASVWIYHIETPLEIGSTKREEPQ